MLYLYVQKNSTESLICLCSCSLVVVGLAVAARTGRGTPSGVTSTLVSVTTLFGCFTPLRWIGSEE